MHGAHALGGLHRERGDRGDTVTIVGGESFQIRSDARAAGGIKSRDRQKDVGMLSVSCMVRVAGQLTVPSAPGTHSGCIAPAAHQ